ncbi:MAG: NADP-dependent malic enzyme [Rhodospirillales bacterium CG15_BIG_FIL_POST_REV_8_21_14_020_66_15]|nr:MAG: NADP-dependent malic enzyme [Rhodospirillales bacterium CG15_BIG_FIL_POST_REV_8_21_14_020_66_15]
MSLKEDAIAYHRADPPGKLEIVATKPMATPRDLSLAYSPGVADACLAIAEDPAQAAYLTGRGNNVAVISNGTAVLGLGNIGALASKPVMEGKAVLFKKFAGINVFDIEINETDPDIFVETVARLEPTFGGINLEDIKAPECFEIETKLKARMNIPVFHDDQHGTAVVTAAAVANGLDIVGKKIEDVRLVCSGAGAAALSCVELLINMGMKPENALICDRSGVIYKGRTEAMDPYKEKFAVKTDKWTLDEAIEGADIFLGLSGPKVLSTEHVARMADKPMVFALANPDPEIWPEEVREVRKDALIATGRSDYPNQINNVLCFPFLFRGAIDVGATEINEAMKLACAKALAELARAEVTDVVTDTYRGEDLRFGPDYLIPKPFDPRLVTEVPPAVAKAAMDSGVATRPIEDWDAYREKLTRLVFRSGNLMKPVFERAKADPRRVVFAEGDSERVLQAVRQVVDEGIAKPIIVGNRERIESRMADLGLRLDLEGTVEVVDPATNPRMDEYSRGYQKLLSRHGITPREADRIVRADGTVLAAIMLSRGHADAMIAGTGGRYQHHLDQVYAVIGAAEGVHDLSAVNALIVPSGTYFMADTYVNPDPSAEEIVEFTLLAAAEMQRFGIEPNVALLSHSNFGSRDTASARKMAEASRLLRERAPNLACDGEMHGDAALSETLRTAACPDNRLKGPANLLVMPNLDAAHIAFNLLKQITGGVSVGPIILGTAKPAHVVSQSITVRGLLNMAAIATVDAQNTA